MQEKRTTEGCIMIQGPMPIEAERLAARLENVEREETGNFIFYIGTLAGHTVVVAKTSKGMENAAAATRVPPAATTRPSRWGTSCWGPGSPISAI